MTIHRTPPVPLQQDQQRSLRGQPDRISTAITPFKYSRALVVDTVALLAPPSRIIEQEEVATSFTGTVAITVAQPSLVASGTVTNPPIAGTVSITVPRPSFAATGLLEFIGTVSITVPRPGFAAVGFITGAEPEVPPVVGGRPRRRAVVHRYPNRRPARFDPADLRVSELHEGTVAISVPMPRFRARGYVTSLAERDADDRFALQLAVDDPDFNFALGDPWMN